MTPTEAPEAPAVQDPQAAAASSEAPVTADGAAPAAAPEIDPEVKKLRDRLAEEGRIRKQNEQLALQQAQQIQHLTTQVGQFSQYVTQQQQADLRNRLAQMAPEEQIAALTEMVLKPQPQSEAAPPATPTPATQAMQQRVQAHLTEANENLSEPISGFESELQGHKDEVSWVKALTRLRVQREKEEQAMPAKPTVKTEERLLTRAEQEAEIARQVARATGVQRPNAAAPAGAGPGGASIQDLNKVAVDPRLGPKARLAKLQELQAAS